jgi:hypothetical protein
MNNVVFALVVIVAYILIQQLESQLVAPRVLGDAVKIPALVVLLAITVGFKATGVDLAATSEARASPEGAGPGVGGSAGGDQSGFRYGRAEVGFSSGPDDASASPERPG